MKATNLNQIFVQFAPEFSHLLTTEPQTKEEFIGSIKKAHFGDNKAILFCAAAQVSDFETIQLNTEKDAILFNHLETN